MQPRTRITLTAAAAALVLIAAALPTVAASPEQATDIRWYASRPHSEEPVELDDDPVVVTLFEITTGWLCYADPVIRSAPGLEAREVHCEKGPDRFSVTLACGPDRPTDVERLQFTRTDAPPHEASRDRLVVGCVVESGAGTG